MSELGHRLYGHPRSNLDIKIVHSTRRTRRRLLSRQSRNVLFFEGVVMLNGSPFPSASIVQNGARGQGFASPRNNRAPLTAPRRSEVVLRRGKGEVRKSWPIGHFYFAGIGHFYFAPTRQDSALTVFDALGYNRLATQVRYSI